MEEAGMQEVDTYVSHLQNIVTQFIATRPIMDLCLVAEGRPGSRVTKRWWDQDRLDMEGRRTASWEAERTEGEDETDGTETETY